MKIFRSDQIKKIDEHTICNEPVASTNLMERAAGKVYDWYISRYVASRPVVIFAGPGNNGGDGLALARLLSRSLYKPEVYLVTLDGEPSKDREINRKRLEKETTVPIITLRKSNQFPEIKPGAIVIDAIIGSGLSRRVEGIASEVIRHINNSDSTVISIDIPSGLFGEDNNNNDPESIIKADYTLSFQFPKLSFMFPENEKYTGEWTILPIGLDSTAIENTGTPYIHLERELIRPLLKNRKKFDHKGTFGHGLLIGGSYGKMGAMVLGAKAALRTGIGLITCHIPSRGDLILQAAIPEAMVIHDNSELLISNIGNTDQFSAVAIGPGMGTESASQKAFYKFLKSCKKPLVIDADALNILSLNNEWLSLLPKKTILTPHLKEFERLAGKASGGFERLKRQIEFSANHNCIVILKGAYSSISSPDGKVWFNSTGNPGMATAGSGDILTGMILALLAQDYDPIDAALSGVYIHGLAGDIASGKLCWESLIATDIIKDIGSAFNRIREAE